MGDTMATATEYLGVAEVAEIAHVTPQAVCNWVRRWSDFPTPLCKLKCTPVWAGTEVREYLKGKGYPREPGNCPSEEA